MLQNYENMLMQLSETQEWNIVTRENMHKDQADAFKSIWFDYLVGLFQQQATILRSRFLES